MKLRKFFISLISVFGIMLVFTLLNNNAKAAFSMEFDTEELTGEEEEYHYYYNEDKQAYELDLTNYEFDMENSFNSTYGFKFDQEKVIVNIIGEVYVSNSVTNVPAFYSPEGEIVFTGDEDSYLSISTSVGICAKKVTIDSGYLDVCAENNAAYYGIRTDELIINNDAYIQICYPLKSILGYSITNADIKINGGEIEIYDTYSKNEYELLGNFSEIYEDAEIMVGKTENTVVTLEELNESYLNSDYIYIGPSSSKHIYDNFYYTIDDDNNVILTGLVDITETDMTIPFEIEECPVIGFNITEEQYYIFNSIEEVRIENISSVFDYSILQHFSNLKEVTFAQTTFDNDLDYSWITEYLDNSTVTLSAYEGTIIEQIANTETRKYNFVPLVEITYTVSESAQVNTVSVNGTNKDLISMKEISYKNTLENFLSNVTNFKITDNNGNLVTDSSAVLGSKYVIDVLDASDKTIAEYTVIVKGDVSGNGECKIYDAFQVLKGALSNNSGLDEIDMVIRDYNDDGKVAIYDAFQYLKQALK